jgi:hypothetical protein
MTRIELVYFGACPHTEAARVNLRAALASARVGSHWTEWNQDEPTTPNRFRAHPSPTVLVNGRDVASGGQPVEAPACRASGAPSVAEIAAALGGSS